MNAQSHKKPLKMFFLIPAVIMKKQDLRATRMILNGAKFKKSSAKFAIDSLQDFNLIKN